MSAISFRPRRRRASRQRARCARRSRNRWMQARLHRRASISRGRQRLSQPPLPTIRLRGLPRSRRPRRSRKSPPTQRTSRPMSAIWTKETCARVSSGHLQRVRIRRWHMRRTRSTRGAVVRPLIHRRTATRRRSPVQAGGRRRGSSATRLRSAVEPTAHASPRRPRCRCRRGSRSRRGYIRRRSRTIRS